MAFVMKPLEEEFPFKVAIQDTAILDHPIVRACIELVQDAHMIENRELHDTDSWHDVLFHVLLRFPERAERSVSMGRTRELRPYWVMQEELECELSKAELDEIYSGPDETIRARTIEAYRKTFLEPKQKPYVDRLGDTVSDSLK